MDISTRERIQGGLWGLLIGDALGVPYEFQAADQIPSRDQIDFEPPKEFTRSYPNIPPGTWSDDGSQALCLLDSLLTCKQLNPDHLIHLLLDWYTNGTWAIDQVVFDIGMQTRESLLAFQNGVPALQAGFVRPEGKGNGSLMRVLPLALWHTGSDESLVMDAHRQSMLTHGHLVNQVCCALYCLWAKKLLKGLSGEQAYRSAVDRLRQIYQQHPEYLAELDKTIRPDDPPASSGKGLVVESLHAARIALQEPSYEQVVKHAIQLGHDTDTNAAIAGGLAGIRDGVNAIPIKWLLQLRGKEMVQPLLDQLLQHRS